MLFSLSPLNLIDLIYFFYTITCHIYFFQNGKFVPFGFLILNKAMTMLHCLPPWEKFGRVWLRFLGEVWSLGVDSCPKKTNRDRSSRLAQSSSRLANMNRSALETESARTVPWVGSQKTCSTSSRLLLFCSSRLVLESTPQVGSGSFSYEIFK